VAMSGLSALPRVRPGQLFGIKVNYNARLTWLVLAHQTLDNMALIAYGWPADLSDEDVLAWLAELNSEQAAMARHQNVLTLSLLCYLLSK